MVMGPLACGATSTPGVGLHALTTASCTTSLAVASVGGASAAWSLTETS